MFISFCCLARILNVTINMGTSQFIIYLLWDKNSLSFYIYENYLILCGKIMFNDEMLKKLQK